ncbi:MAG: CBS domain-containing protein [Phycisphaerae bacterium]
MPFVQNLLCHKSGGIHTIRPDATVYEATRKMNELRLGALVVTDPARPGRPLGMFTERDVLMRVVAEKLNPDKVAVGEVMTRSVIVCCPTDEIEDVAATMKRRRVRHLPVCNGHELVGLISQGDINAWHVEQAAAQVASLSDYIYGRA